MAYWMNVADIVEKREEELILAGLFLVLQWKTDWSKSDG